MFGRIIVRWIINAVAIFVAVRLLGPERIVANDSGILIVALILGFVNAIIRPILAILTCPLILLTLGLFTLVINALMLYLSESIAQILGAQFDIVGDFWTVFLAALIVSVVSFLLSMVLGDEERGRAS
jgi:putative membrane protein